jgi:hypothetical protein
MTSTGKWADRLDKAGQAKREGVDSENRSTGLKRPSWRFTPGIVNSNIILRKAEYTYIVFWYDAFDLGRGKLMISMLRLLMEPARMRPGLGRRGERRQIFYSKRPQLIENIDSKKIDASKRQHFY